MPSSNNFKMLAFPLIQAFLSSPFNSKRYTMPPLLNWKIRLLPTRTVFLTHSSSPNSTAVCSNTFIKFLTFPSFTFNCASSVTKRSCSLNPRNTSNSSTVTLSLTYCS
uniref:(northern house mosquito) hypothetical protein n=1 Tax=Culex pipiens TaxID=7175 RepID=A0A8D8BBX9_CULPI